MSQCLSKQNDVVYYRPNTEEDYSPFKTYRYHWHHIPSQARGLEKVCCLSKSDFDKLISLWNAKPEIWEYVAAQV